MVALDELKEFSLSEASVQLWVFKKSTRGGQPVFTGRWVDTTDDLDAAMRQAVANERARITEVQEYGLLTQANEGSALSIGTVETHAGLVLDQANAAVDRKKVRDLKAIQNTEFYAIKLVVGDRALYAVRKADASWRTKRRLQSISVYFSDHTLGLVTDPGFSISRNVDFFVVGDKILISSKPNFESVLGYKAAHVEDFKLLREESEFSSVFTSLEALLQHVGENKIQLRRASAIRQKGHYKDPVFMANLRQNAALFGLSITFDEEGKIIPTMENCQDIIQALLDHRLQSGFSRNIYDVQDTSNVNVT
ncbi:Kiwa anti-phage protein KwaB-like domain-containing protein [Xanthobacter autotrophicus]|uniref:Kiwa anti-phage protein KwaB-like domain-containing protein n=1 Tax=Xanthobacter autotrophicus TaxID=280 RepID=UPI0024A63EF9|nr:Kiwa anti-phage protein KwaB-like domain-containing protein [Xanthobacter autotrophicus]MDI4657533.1 DUF4868 domain-containing protein [Xanthobacter autotrophicus]